MIGTLVIYRCQCNLPLECKDMRAKEQDVGGFSSSVAQTGSCALLLRDVAGIIRSCLYLESNCLTSALPRSNTHT